MSSRSPPTTARSILSAIASHTTESLRNLINGSRQEGGSNTSHGTELSNNQSQLGSRNSQTWGLPATSIGSQCPPYHSSGHPWVAHDDSQGTHNPASSAGNPGWYNNLSPSQQYEEEGPPPTLPRRPIAAAAAAVTATTATTAGTVPTGSTGSIELQTTNVIGDGTESGGPSLEGYPSRRNQMTYGKKKRRDDRDPGESQDKAEERVEKIVEGAQTVTEELYSGAGTNETQNGDEADIEEVAAEVGNAAGEAAASSGCWKDFMECLGDCDLAD